MAYRVGVVGASGYAGAELVRLLSAHPALDLAVVAASSHAGKAVADLYPNLPTGARFDAVDVEVLAGLDLVFLATPHGAAAELGGALHRGGTRVVDVSAAYRLDAATFADWYGEDHPHPDLAPAVYGLTEWAREPLRGAGLVANPGCYPTAALLALLPLAGLLQPGSVVVDAKSGTSGAGRGLRDDLHHAHIDGSVTAYGAPRHRHTPEIERWLAVLGGREVGAVTFTPHLVPMARGLLATCYALLAEGVAADDARAAVHDAYRDERFVHVLPQGAFPVTKAVNGSNGCQVAVVVDERTRRATAVAAIDNLGKGAAGQAVQNANLMLGLDEDLGLTATGVYP